MNNFMPINLKIQMKWKISRKIKHQKDARRNRKSEYFCNY